MFLVLSLSHLYVFFHLLLTDTIKLSKRSLGRTPGQVSWYGRVAIAHSHELAAVVSVTVS